MRNRRGVSLFETIAALTMVAMVAVSALAAVGAEMRTADKARRAHEVEALATERLVQLWILTDRDLQSLPDSIASGRFDPPLDEYTWTTYSTPDNTLAGLYIVRVDIEWLTGTYSATSAQYRRPVLSTRSR